jgi:hypothetical protein
MAKKWHHKSGAGPFMANQWHYKSGAGPFANLWCTNGITWDGACLQPKP